MAEINELSDTEFLFQVLTFIAPLNQSLQDTIRRFLKEERFPKKHLLLKEGQTAKRIYFIKHGFARAYFFDREGHENTSWFMGTSDLMISVYSFFTQQPASESIELLEDSLMQSITWQELQTIYAEHPEFNYFGRIITEKYYIQAEERAILLRTKKASERYKLLLKAHPNILQQASLGQIASHLGITQETLSRLRSQKDI